MSISQPPCGHGTSMNAADHQLSNRICWLYLHDPAYNKLWGGDGNVTPGPPFEASGPIQQSVVVKHTIQLGDAVEKALSLVGITKERVSGWLGKPCGCGERQAKLNKLGEWAMGILRGEKRNLDIPD